MNEHLDKIAELGQRESQADIRLGMDVERARIVSLIKALDCPYNGVEHDCATTLKDWTVHEIIGLITEGTND